jgi:hypothetical protein
MGYVPYPEACDSYLISSPRKSTRRTLVPPFLKIGVPPVSLRKSRMWNIRSSTTRERGPGCLGSSTGALKLAPQTYWKILKREVGSRLVRSKSTKRLRSKINSVNVFSLSIFVKVAPMNEAENFPVPPYKFQVLQPRPILISSCSCYSSIRRRIGIL